MSLAVAFYMGLCIVGSDRDAQYITGRNPVIKMIFDKMLAHSVSASSTILVERNLLSAIKLFPVAKS